MIKRELKVNFKSWLIWLGILVGMFLFVYILYPFLITDETMKEMDEMMKIFPEEVMKAFNMDMTSISTAYGWFKSEGFMYVLLIIGFYSSILGSSIVLKEENDQTIEYLGSLPITRNKILMNKIIVGFIYVIGMVLLLGVFNYVALMISCDLDQKQFILLSITPIFIGLPLFSFNLFLSTFMHKTKTMFGISLGLVFLFYLLNVLSELSENVKFLKYLSIYTLADVRNVILNIEIQPVMVIVSFTLTALFIIGSYLQYNKKELV